MGEAKRRKLAGEYPQSGDPIAAARRFWCGRDPGPVEHFQVPQGLVGITIDVQGTAPSTYLVDAQAITDLATDIQRRVSKFGLNYRAIVRTIAEEFTKAKQAHDDTALQGIGPLSLWSALHHPDTGTLMRAKVSAELRDKGRAHITWGFSDRGLAIALADKFIDLAGVLASAPRDRVVACLTPDDGEKSPARRGH